MQEELEAAREHKEELQKQLDSLRDMYTTSRCYIGLNERHFKEIDSSLGMLSAPPFESWTQRVNPRGTSFRRWTDVRA